MDKSYCKKCQVNYIQFGLKPECSILRFRMSFVLNFLILCCLPGLDIFWFLKMI